MLQTAYARRGMITAPHHLAAQAGLAVLRDGGNAVEAMVAAAAAIAVVYPHMNAIGGDGFWLVSAPGADPVAIRACGAAAAAATPDLYRSAATHHPAAGRWPRSRAGTVSGWQAALEVAAAWGGRPLPLARLLEEAIHHATAGVPVTASQAHYTAEKAGEIGDTPGFRDIFLPAGRPPVPGEVLANPALAGTLRRLAADGLDGFYRGDLARTIAADWPARSLAAIDLSGTGRCGWNSVAIAAGTVFNCRRRPRGVVAGDPVPKWAGRQ
jgi:gamma-glutamyltranspeptidase/glutathione hydrolase